MQTFLKFTKQKCAATVSIHVAITQGKKCPCECQFCVLRKPLLRISVVQVTRMRAASLSKVVLGFNGSSSACGWAWWCARTTSSETEALISLRRHSVLCGSKGMHYNPVHFGTRLPFAILHLSTPQQPKLHPRHLWELCLQALGPGRGYSMKVLETGKKISQGRARLLLSLLSKLQIRLLLSAPAPGTGVMQSWEYKLSSLHSSQILLYFALWQWSYNFATQFPCCQQFPAKSYQKGALKGAQKAGGWKVVLCACCSGQHQPGSRLGSSFQCLCSIRGHLDLSSALCSAISSCPLLGDPSPSSVRPLLQGPGFWSPQLLPVVPPVLRVVAAS